MKEVGQQIWNEYYHAHPQAHILQSPAWGELKSSYGWQIERVIEGQLGAQILFQALPLGFSVGYLPRGPISPGDSPPQHQQWQSFLNQIDRHCRRHRAIFLKMEPDVWRQGKSAETPWPGFQVSSHAIQPPRTIVISLQESEEEILARMKSKTRYNIRLAKRKKVEVRKINRVQPFYDMLEGTADRADFGIHTPAYYRKAYELFQADDRCGIFLAEYQGLPLASIMVFISGTRSWYFYGASSERHRDRMPTYLVQWEAMRWAKQQGCLEYDLWGVPDACFNELEDQFLQRKDGLWGVYRFKRGFGGELRRTVGPWDRVYHPWLYRVYRIWGGIRS